MSFAAEWWVHFGGSAKNLKVLAVKILSQTVSSSGCERNWSTFGLIHSKQRNRLKQKRLNDLVYVHYNLRLRLKCIQEEVELKYPDPTASSYIDEDEDPMIGWVMGQQQQQPELDEPGSPPRPASFVASEAGVDAGQWATSHIPHRAPADTAHRPSPPSSRPGDRGKGKAVAPPSEHSVHSDSDTRDSDDSASDSGGSSDQGGAGGQESQPPIHIRFTGESQFSHATQDTDHGVPSDRPRGDTIPYRRRAPRGRSGHDTAADLARGVGSLDVSGSSSYSGSSYPQLPAASGPYDPYGASETSASSGYYPGASYASDFVAGIFGFPPAPALPYRQSLDSSQSRDIREGSAISYDPSRIPPGMSLEEYHAAWQEGHAEFPTEYIHDPYIYGHRHSTRF